MPPKKEDKKIITPTPTEPSGTVIISSTDENEDNVKFDDKYIDTYPLCFQMPKLNTQIFQSEVDVQFYSSK
jgi:hypothetical protein